jgi:hypothetical protein
MCMVTPTCWHLLSVISTRLHCLRFSDTKTFCFFLPQIIFIICEGYIDNSFKMHGRTHSSLYVYNKTYNSKVILLPKKDGFLFGTTITYTRICGKKGIPYVWEWMKFYRYNLYDEHWNKIKFNNIDWIECTPQCRIRNYQRLSMKIY